MSDAVPSQDPSGARSPSPTMTVPELAERCGIDTSTAYRYLRAGRLPGLNPGNGWIIDRQRVERFMAGREDAAGQPLIHAAAATDTPLSPGVSLTLLPERTPDTCRDRIELAAWGASRDGAARRRRCASAERGYRAPNRGVAPFSRGQKAQKRVRDQPIVIDRQREGSWGTRSVIWRLLRR